MLRELYIEGYRGIKRAEIKDLAQINIFIGKNNSGKSSILEAIYLLSSAFSKSDPLERNKIEYLLSRRGVGTPSWTTAKELLWYNYQTENPIFISTRLDSDEKIDTFLYEWRDVPLIKLEKTQGIDYTKTLLDMVNNQLVDPLNKSTVFHNYPPLIEIIKSSIREYDKFLEYMKNLTLLDFSTIIRDLKLFEKKHMAETC